MMSCHAIFSILVFAVVITFSPLCAHGALHGIPDDNHIKRTAIVQRTKQEALVGHVFRSIQAENDMECFIECFRDKRCSSFNYKNVDDGMPLCELNDHTEDTNPEDLIFMDDFDFYNPVQDFPSELPSTIHPTASVIQSSSGVNLALTAVTMPTSRVTSASQTSSVTSITSAVTSTISSVTSASLTSSVTSITSAVTSTASSVTSASPTSSVNSITSVVTSTASSVTGASPTSSVTSITSAMTSTISSVTSASQTSSVISITSAMTSTTSSVTSATPSVTSITSAMNNTTSSVTSTTSSVTSPTSSVTRITTAMNSTTSSGISASPTSSFVSPSASVFNQVSSFDIDFPRKNKEDYVILDNMPVSGLNQFTISLMVKLKENGNHTLISYAVPTKFNEMLFRIRKGEIRLRLGSTIINSKYELKADGYWHHVAATWENIQGSMRLYVDGVVRFTGSGFAVGVNVQEKGKLVLGNKQKEFGGGFLSKEALVGTISRLNIWGTVLSEEVIKSFAQTCGNETGSPISWDHFKPSVANYFGEAKYIEPSTCSR